MAVVEVGLFGMVRVVMMMICVGMSMVVVVVVVVLVTAQALAVGTIPLLQPVTCNQRSANH